MAAGPAFEEAINKVYKDNPGVQVLVLDLYNSTFIQSESYRQRTGVTAPILPLANTLPFGARLEHLLVVDQTRTIRFWTDVTNQTDYPKLRQTVDALVAKHPLITLSLRQLYFGAKLEVGQAKTVELHVENTGEGPLKITGYSAPEGIVVEPDAFTVNAHEKKTVQITLAPTQPGVLSGRVALQHNHASVGALEVSILDLTIEPRQAPSIGLSQQALDLGQVEVGQAVQQTIAITNGGPGALTVSDIQTDLPGVDLSPRQFSLPPGASREVTITFSPRAEGPFSGALTVISDDPEKGALAIALSGIAIVIPADPRADFNGNGAVDFSDFLAFVSAFGAANPTFDLDGNGRVDFNDFLIFAQSFGKPVR